MKLSQLFATGKFVVTSEIGPPKGTEIEPILEEYEPLRGRVDGVNVTDLQSSVMRLGSLAVCHLLKERGFEPIFQLTCRDRNRLALQSDLISAYVLGIENVLLLTGDYPTLGDHPEAMPVFDLDSVQLLQVAKRLQEGYDMAGKELQGKPSFCLGAVVNPGANPLEPQIIKMEKKVKAGAEFFQTQAVYEVDKFAHFMDQVKYLNVPVMAGIVLLKSAGMAKFMNANVAGVHVPDDLIQEMAEAGAKDKAAKAEGKKADNQVKKSIEIAARLISQLKPYCQGVHIMSIGWDKYVPAVLDAAGL